MKERTWLGILLSFAAPCRGKMAASVVLAILSVAGGFVPYLGVYQIIRLFLERQANWEGILFWCGVCLAGYAVKVAGYALSTMLAHVSAYTILEGLRLQAADRLMGAPLGEVACEGAELFQKLSSKETLIITVDNTVGQWASHFLYFSGPDGRYQKTPYVESVPNFDIAEESMVSDNPSHAMQEMSLNVTHVLRTETAPLRHLIPPKRSFCSALVYCFANVCARKCTCCNAFK